MMKKCFFLAFLTIGAGVSSARSAPPLDRFGPATGVGVGVTRGQGPQARLMAQRAAEVRAVRDLGGKLGVPNGGTVRGFRYVRRERLPNGHVRVIVRADRHPR